LAVAQLLFKQCSFSSS